MNILGVRLGHDAAATLVVNGKILATVAEERMTRVKNDSSFPDKAIAKCLEIGGIKSTEIDILALPNTSIPEQFFVFFELPKKYKKFNPRIKNGGERGEGVPIFPLYKKPYKLSEDCEIHLCEHHRAHAASAYYTSGLMQEGSLIVTMDGAGDGVSCALWRGYGSKIELIKKFDTESSLGWFYSNCTEALGWRHGSGEWKVMGLAPYGTPVPGLLNGFHPVFEGGELVKSIDYGSFGRWNDHGSNHYHGRDAEKIERILSTVSREDFAAEVQRVVEEQAFNLILPWVEKEDTKNICCAGGFFLNVKLNQKLWYTNLLKNQWVYPDCGDSGIPAGAALDAFYNKNPECVGERLTHMYFGHGYSQAEIDETLLERGLTFRKSEDPAQEAAALLADNKVVAWFQGRMEAGPRALGNRSILMSPLKASNKDLINEKVKFREKFRPFCPSIIYEDKQVYFGDVRDEEFMVTSFKVMDAKKAAIPAVVHSDGTARPQLVRKEVNPLYHRLISEFGKITGESVILNTSFNVRGEPIVCTPREAVRCFYDTGIDALILGNCILEKRDDYKVNG